MRATRSVAPLSLYPATQTSPRLGWKHPPPIAGGRNGRRKTNATFYNSHDVDRINELWFAMDLSPLAEDDTLDLQEFVQSKIKHFETSVIDGLS